MTDMLFISQVPNYILMKYSVTRTRRAVTYWITRGYLVGKKHVHLKVEYTGDGQLYTRYAWVDKFIEKVSRR